MSAKYKRWENPEPGRTLLITGHSVWTEKPPLPPPVAKGIELPSWGHISSAVSLLGIITMMYHYKHLLIK